MADIRQCPECGEPILADAQTCHHCDADVEFDMDRGGIWQTLQSRLVEATAGKYEVEGVIGYGGMAGVYLARDVALNRPVALKLISPAVVMDPKMVRRFRQEAQTMAQLNHRHIVPVYDIRESGDLLYIVMQYVSGRTLSEVVTDASGGLPPELVATWMVQICDALSHAHDRGTPVIHRDIKPSNILLDDAGQALLTDFGIAKVQGDAGLTRTGHLIGTPAYMSPEQCRGDSLTVASDQYSLGTVAYELLAGVPPFRGPTLMVLQAHSAKEPEGLASTRPECPPQLAAVVERMLAKNPQDRWSSMAAVTEEFRSSVDRLVPASDLMMWGRRVKDIGLHAPPGPLTPGTRERLEARLLDADGAELTGRAVRWSSTHRDIVSVSVDGVLAAHSVGRAVIVGRSGGAVATLDVEVVLPKAVRLEVTPDSVELLVGEEAQLEVRAYSSDGVEVPAGAVDWDAGDRSVVEVDGGRLEASSPGEVVVAARVGGLRGEARVLVRPVPVTRVVIEAMGSPMEVGDHHVFVCRVEGPNGEPLQDRAVAWSSSGSEVATVDQMGKVFAITPGRVEITASCEGVDTTAAVEVVAQTVSQVFSSVPSVELTAGQQEQLEAYPVDKYGRPIPGRVLSWTSSDDAVVQVTPRGEVRGLAAGTAALTIECEGQSAEVLVVVRGADATVVMPRPSGASPDRTQVLSGLDWGAAPLDLAPPPPGGPGDGPAHMEPPAAPAESEEGPQAPVEEPVVRGASAPPVDGLTVTMAKPAPDVAKPKSPPVKKDGGGPPPTDLVRPAEGDPAPSLPSPAPWTLVDRIPPEARRPLAGAGVASLALLAWLFWPGGGDSFERLEVATAPADTTVSVGARFQLRTDVASDRLGERDAVWASSDPAVATVSPTGLVEAVGPGNATFSLSGRGLETDGPRTLSVLSSDAVALVGPTTIEAGGQARFQVRRGDGSIVPPDSAVWSASPAEIATVDAGGTLFARSDGLVALSVVIGADTVLGQVTVEPVQGPAYTELILDPAPTRVQVDATVQVTAWLLDQDQQRHSAAGVVWSSTDEGVLASVGGGRFRAVGPGTAAVVASHGETSLSRRQQVTVAAPVQQERPPEPPPEPRDPVPARV
ncbi:MAG: Ig-like domain-containing protein, partial [Gemmatimonadota bacterium]|nr:Ig-like domain-containing protein [Gemmatimonadota bacterium]